jgi:hypothetical protein
MTKPFVSVLIDTYNHERFIEEAIASVLEQDFPAEDREILVVDDGSTDSTPEIVRKFEPQVRLLRKTNGGQASAFNAGIPECQGEIVAFLDGDDWWAKAKLTKVVEAMSANPTVGVVGHGITEVYTDGREHTELLREVSRFRIDSQESARLFRLRKSFLGTSRMALQAKILAEIGKVPEALRIQADEYLFTMGAFLSEVLILREPLTYYRLHDSNAFQVTNGNMEALGRKQQVLAKLAESLRRELKKRQIPEGAERIVVDSVETEANLIRLSLANGWPQETLRAELHNYRIMHNHASFSQWVLKCIVLLPACVMPSHLYYSLRFHVSRNGLYLRMRERWFPFPEPKHVDRYRTTRP